MNTPATTTTKLNWKVAAAIGTVAGVGLGGFVFAGSDSGGLTPGQVELQDAPDSAPRLSAPVVIPPTSTSLASAASVNLSPRSPAPTTISRAESVTPAVAELNSVDSPVSVNSPASLASPASPASAQSSVSVDSPASPAGPASVQSPDSPDMPITQAPAPAPDSPDSPASPASPGSPGSGHSS